MFGDSRFRTGSLFVLISLFFGGTFVAVKAGLAHFPPLLFAAFRFDVAAVALLGYVGLTRSEWRPRTRRDWASVLLTGGLVLGISNALLFVGQQYTTSAIAAIIYSLVPVLTPVFAFALLAEERVSLVGGAGLLVGFLGVGLVVRPDATTLVGGSALGKAVLLLGAVSSALGTVLLRRVDASGSSLVVTAWGLPVGAFLLHGASVVAGESVTAVEWTGAALLALAFVGILSGAVAYAAYFEVLATVGAIQANVVNYVVPVVAAITGWLLLGEVIAPLTAVGFVVIAVGFLLVQHRVVRAVGRQVRDSVGPAHASPDRGTGATARDTATTSATQSSTSETCRIDARCGDD